MTTAPARSLPARTASRAAGWGSIVAFGLGLALAWAGGAAAAPSGPQVSLDLGADGQRISTAVELLVLFTLLSLAPSIVIGVTAFVRIAIVLGFLRQAVGTPQMPPNQVVISLALFLTFFVMMPTLRLVNEQGVQPYVEERVTALEAVEKGFQPLREFMLRQTREKDLALFVGISGRPRPDSPAELAPEVVIPAFLVSELKRVASVTATCIGMLVVLAILQRLQQG